MRILVVGAGPIGRRHARNVLALGHEVAVFRRAGGGVEGLDAPVFGELAEAERWEPEAVVVANPPAKHLETAAWAVERGCSVLIEKPLAAAPEGADELLDAAKRRGVHLAVAHNLRFHPALQAIAGAVASGAVGRLLVVRAEVGSYLPSWHPDRDYRSGSAARAELGGGALLTLIHELDYVLWICGPGSLVAGVRTKVSKIEINADDVAEVVLLHDSGTLSSIHMDFVDRAYNRRSRWVGDQGTIEWTWGGAVEVHGPRAGILWQDEGFDLNETYAAELKAFLERQPAPGDGLGDARRALQLAESVAKL